MIDFLSIAGGGFLGAISRYAVSRKWNRTLLPYGTLIVNLSGAFILGVIAGSGLTGHYFLFAATGFLGAFTTFSTLNLELAKQVMERKYKVVLIYAGMTYIGGLLLAFAGFWIGNSM
ncbi:fluoride efflux transporter FluC [Bacillus sp. SJS]|uniref:fluoride efflux transporter FluC n=1 Tax=Bacillus sp. SJS TaxID=1423321 RepID=UPI0004DCEACC|nr:CrcB family protein [Bacillus sp. SJS]KZZ84759.1 hypothetical protein AS29_009515 [Bacillus sp. SJS]